MLGFPRQFAIGPSWRLSSIDDLFQGMNEILGHSTEKTFDLDVKEEGDNFIVRADMPGIPKEDVNVTLENGVLTISAERSSENDGKEGNFQIRERSYGKFSRSIQVPGEIDTSSVSATLQDGVLQLILRQSESCKPRKIDIT